MSTVVNEKFLLKIGARGRHAGPGQRVDWDESSYGNVQHILVFHGECINSIQMVYYHNGSSAIAPRRGGCGGDFFHCITLGSEYLTSISGHYGAMEQGGPVVIRSLKFATNMTSYGPFGQEEGTPFCSHCSSGFHFGGFHGCCDDNHLCSFGVYVKNSSIQYSFKPDPVRGTSVQVPRFA